MSILPNLRDRFSDMLKQVRYKRFKTYLPRFIILLWFANTRLKINDPFIFGFSNVKNSWRWLLKSDSDPMTGSKFVKTLPKVVLRLWISKLKQFILNFKLVLWLAETLLFRLEIKSQNSIVQKTWHYWENETPKDSRRKQYFVGRFCCEDKERLDFWIHRKTSSLSYLPPAAQGGGFLCKLEILDKIKTHL